MFWIIAFIPVCAWLSYYLLKPLNILTNGTIFIIAAGFFLYESFQLKKNPGRQKTPVIIIGIVIISVLAGIAMHYLI